MNNRHINETDKDNPIRFRLQLPAVRHESIRTDREAVEEVGGLPVDPFYPVLQELAGVETPAVLLSGTWQFQYSPDSKWDKIQVPGEPAMQGYAIEHDKPFTYRKSFTVPADYAGKHTILRFDGVYSHARLFVNGTFVRDIMAALPVGRRMSPPSSVPERKTRYASK